MLLCDGAHANRETAMLVVGHYLYSIYMENHICFETMGGQRCCLTESCCVAFHIHIVQVY